ncbi:GLPGLI family protein [Ascidiimonas aurantiaca]|uniref:GLPGLI family protein n=1 Tax=Ascidiimonas aurantiaca TaxID=1685432 RepID=UPI0030EB6F2E
MKKILLLAVLNLIFNYAFSQSTKEKIITVTYKSIPFSQYYFNHSDTDSQEKIELDYALRAGYEHFYTLHINPATNQSIFVFDTLKITKVKGKEDYWTDPENKIAYCLKKSDGFYQRNESVFDQTFFINGNIGDIEWEITNEQKEILGFTCTKAVSKNEKLLLTAWFTQEIPVNTGPSNYLGLPGLVVWAEDYFNTFSVQKISYSVTPEIFKQKLDDTQNTIKKNHEDGLSEKIYQLKKSNLVKQLRSY